jgi:hypothetical protein
VPLAQLYSQFISQRRKEREGRKGEEKKGRGRGIVSTISVKFHAMLSDKNPFFFLCVLCAFAFFA